MYHDVHIKIFTVFFHILGTTGSSYPNTSEMPLLAQRGSILTMKYNVHAAFQDMTYNWFFVIYNFWHISERKAVSEYKSSTVTMKYNVHVELP